jgi:hypothetical protein
VDFRVSRHAEWEMGRRGIGFGLVQAVMDNPEQRLVDESREDEQPAAIITAYRTSKIEKYWRTE